MELRRSKNVATYIVVPLVDADGDLVTGATGLDSEIDAWSDGGAPDGFTDCTNEATEIGSTGLYYLSLTQAEMNNDYVVVQIKTSTSGAKTQVVLINCKNQPADILAISGDATAADNCELMFDGTGYAGGTTKLDVNAVTVEGTDATNAIRDAVVDDATRIDASALNTLSSHDPGEAIMGATDIGTGSGLSAIPWNAAWDAEVQSECADALAAYDPPTKAELDTAQGAVTLANGPHGGAAATLALGGAGGLTGAITGNLSGSVGSVTGAVGSVAAGGITAASIATGAIDADAIAADAVTEIQSGLATSAEVTALNDLDAAGVQAAAAAALAAYDPPTRTEATSDKNEVLAALPSSGPSAAAIADAVWDEALAGHAAAGSAGAALTGAGVAGDPWTAALPGDYEADTAGAILPALKSAMSVLGAGDVTVTSPVAASGAVTIYAGDDYDATHGREISFAVADATHALGLDDPAAVARFKCSQATWTGTATSTATGYTVAFEPTDAQTASLTIARQSYELEATLADGDVVTLATGTLVVVRDIPVV